MSPIIGIIADTHGTFLDNIRKIFRGCKMIIHAGDIGNTQVIEALSSIAPVYAIRGNVDKGQWAENIPVSRTIRIQDVNIYVIHNLKEMTFNPKIKGYDIVISGHSHISKTVIKDEVLYINPGGAGRKRFSLPLTVALLTIHQGRCTVDFKYL